MVVGAAAASDRPYVIPPMHMLANIGVPMIGAYWPPAWLAFIPVVIIEAWWARRTLRNGWSKALASTFVANAVSTLIGIPLIWFLWATIQLRYFGSAIGLDNPAKGAYAVTVQAAWLIPYERDLWWMILLAALAMTAVFCVASIVMEWLVMKLLQRQANGAALRQWAWKGNLCSYAVIFAFVILFLYVPRTSLDRVAGGPVRFVMDLAWRAAG
jgi:hypothetical protein